MRFLYEMPKGSCKLFYLKPGVIIRDCTGNIDLSLNALDEQGSFVRYLGVDRSQDALQLFVSLSAMRRGGDHTHRLVGKHSCRYAPFQCIL